MSVGLQVKSYRFDTSKTRTLNDAYNNGTFANPRTASDSTPLKYTKLNETVTAYKSDGTTSTTNPQHAFVSSMDKIKSGIILKQSNYQSLRTQLNGDPSTQGMNGLYNKFEANRYTTAAPQTNNNNTLNNAMALATAGLGLVESAKQIFGSSTPQTSSVAQMTGGINTGSKSSVSTGSISAMENAKDSTSLRGAMEDANKELSDADTQERELSQGMEGMKSAADKATQELTTLNKNVTAKGKEVSEKQTDVNNAQSGVTSSEKTFELAKQRLGEAATNYDKAETGLKQAQATLSNTPQTIDGPNGTKVQNPAYAKAQAAVKAAEAQEQQAKAALDKAKQDDTAAGKNYDAAKKQLENNQATLKTAQTQLKDLQEQFNKLNEQKKKDDGVVKQYEKAKTDLNAAKEKKAALQNAIKKQGQRLTELQNKETKDLESTNSELDKKIGKMAERDSQVNTKDGLSAKEKFKLAQNKITDKNAQKLQAKQDELELKTAYTKLWGKSATAMSKDGVSLRKGTCDGKDIYMIGAKPATKEQYEAMLQQDES